MAFLKVVSGTGKGKRFEIDRDDVTVGRAPENALVIDDPSISGRHCRIVRDGRRFTLRDIESTNGTRLNGVRISEHQLSPGDVLTAGSIDVLFDGEDIDGYKPLPAADEKPQLTLKLPATGAGRHPPADFNPRKRRTWVLFLVYGLVGVALLAAMAWFLFRLLTS